MTAIRRAIPDFQLANPIYTAARVTFYEVDEDGARTATLATLYANPTGPETASNPQTLDADGKFLAPVYSDTPCMAEVTGPNVATHSTGAIGLRGTWRGDWTTAAHYFSNDLVQDPDTSDVYVVADDYQAGASVAIDVAAGKLVIVIDQEVLTAVPLSSALWGPYTSISAASTVNLASADRIFVRITGASTTITSLGSGADRLRIVRTDSAQTFTNSASLICPNGIDFISYPGTPFLVATDSDGKARIIGSPPLATLAEAQAGTASLPYMSPARVQDFLTAKFASQVQAEAGSSTSVVMSPARTTNFFNINRASQAEAEAGTDNVKFLTSLQGKNALQNGLFYNHGAASAIDRSVPDRLRDVVSLRDFTAGTSNDDTAVQKWLDAAAGAAAYVPHGTFTFANASVSSSTRIFGPGKLVQRSAGQPMFVCTSISDVLFDDVWCEGLASLGAPAEVTGNYAIQITTSEDVRVHRGRFKRFLTDPVVARGSSDIEVVGARFKECAGAVFYTGVNGGLIAHNRALTCVLASGQFVTVFALDSTDGHAYGICKKIDIIGNRLKGFHYCQGILAHAGQEFSIIGNMFEDASIGISVNPIRSADITKHIVVASNNLSGETESHPGNGSQAIAIQSGGVDYVDGVTSLPNITDVIVVDNHINSYNVINDLQYGGGMRFGWVDGLIVGNNQIAGCKGNGIVYYGPITGLVHGGNQVRSLSTNTATENRAVHVHDTVTGAIDHDTYLSVTDGVYLGVACASLNLGRNTYLTVTNNIVNPTNAGSNENTSAAIDALGSSGLIARTGSGTVSARTLTAPAAGLTITNPAGTAGNPTFALANDLAALEGLGSTGIAARTDSDTWAQRTLQIPAAGLAITNPAGVAGDPTFAFANDLAAVEGLSGTGLIRRTGTDTWSAGTTVTVPEGGTGVAAIPAFRVHRNGVDQSFSVSTATKIQFTTEEFDTNSNFDNATNYRFTPTVAGKYIFTLSVESSSSMASTKVWRCYIYKNGSRVATGSGNASGGSNGAISVCSTILDANGSTDYFEAYIYSDDAGSLAIYGSSTNTHFSGCRIGT